jgi:hypothetical protein
MDETRVTAYWYASQRGLPADLDFLLEFGIRAARHARWLGIAESKIPEGPYLVHAWPESVWAYAAPASPAQAAAMTAAGRAARERAHQQRVAAGIAEIYSRLDAGEFRALAGARGRDGEPDPGWPPMCSEDM